jgi:hypothetical protein
VNRGLFAFLASIVVSATLGESTESTKIRITTWNLQWFPNGSANEGLAGQQNQRITDAANVLRPINPDIILLQEVRDYDVCARLGEPSRRDLTASQFALPSKNHSRGD